jgi:hypothetical protein
VKDGILTSSDCGYDDRHGKQKFLEEIFVDSMLCAGLVSQDTFPYSALGLQLAKKKFLLVYLMMFLNSMRWTFTGPKRRMN